MFSPKDPHSSEFFAFDFTQLLTDGDSVAGIVGVTFDATDVAATKLVMGSPAQNGNLVVVRLSAGTPGYNYAIRAEVTTAAGETLDLTAYVLIRTQL